MSEIHYINSSRLARWRKCRRFFFWSNVFEGSGLAPDAPEPEYLSTGKAAHHGLALAYRRGIAGDDIASVAEQQWYREQGIDQWEATEEQDQSAQYVNKLLTAYFLRDEPRDDFTIEKVEDSFVVQLGEVCWRCGEVYKHDESHVCPACGAPVYFLVGRIDLGVMRNGKFVLIDHKTSKDTPDEAYAAKFQDSKQQIGYVYGYGKLHGLDIRTFGINFLQKARTVGEEGSQLKQCPVCKGRKKKEPTVFNCTTCGGTGKVERENPLQPFRRYYFDLTDEDIDRYLISTVRTLRDIEDEAKLFDVEPDVAYPMDADSACSYCPMYNLCYTGNPQRWYDRKSYELDGFKKRKADYVDLIAEEAV